MVSGAPRMLSQMRSQERRNVVYACEVYRKCEWLSEDVFTTPRQIRGTRLYARKIRPRSAGKERTRSSVLDIAFYALLWLDPCHASPPCLFVQPQ